MTRPSRFEGTLGRTLADSEPWFDEPPHPAELRAQFRRGQGFAGSVEIFIDGQACGSGDIPLYMRMISSVGASIGYDHGSAVSARYQAPFAYSGSLSEVTIQLVSARDSQTQADEAATEMSRQ